MPTVIALRQRLRRVRLIGCALAFALAASGCTGLVYNRLDALAGWYLGSLVSLDAEQRQDLRTWLTSMLQWHRASELGRYVEFVRDLAGRAATPGDRKAYARTEAQIEAFASELVRQAAPEAVRLLRRLSDAQLDELDRNLEERALERALESQKALKKGVWRKERERDLRRQLKRWTGSITGEQKTLIAEAAAQFEFTSNDWLESQRQWRRLLIEALRAHPAAEERILRLLREPNAHWTAEYSAKNERNRARSLALLERLDVSLTQTQREHLRRELEQLAEQLEDLRET
jgi:hypothetical protein